MSAPAPTRHETDTDGDVIIRLEGVGKAYDLTGPKSARWRIFGRDQDAAQESRFWALRDINLTVTRGRSLGILGLNGAGKSTLLSVIAGAITANEGTVDIAGRVQFLQLGVGFNPGKTGRENIRDDARAHGFDANAVQRIVDYVEEFADIGPFFDQPVSTYSSGMRGRVAFGNAFANDPEVLIVDEALAVGDAVFVNKCYRRLREAQDRGTTLLFTSHSSDAIVRLCSDGIVLNKGRIVASGSAKDAADAYKAIVQGSAADEVDENAVPAIAETVSTPASDMESFAFADTDGRDRVPHCPLYNRHESKSGDARASIIDCAVFINGAVAKDDIVGLGDKIDIFYQVKFHEDLAEPHVGIILEDTTGIPYYGTNQLWNKDVLPPCKAGEMRTYHASFPAHLAKADWFITLAVADALTVCQQRSAVLKFKLDAEQRPQVGSGWLPMTLDLED